MWDTGMGAGRTVAAALLALTACSGSAAAEPAPLRAKVVWAQAGRVYVASADSLPLEEGDLLTFQDGRKVVASSTVSAIHEGTLAVARVESGSLDRVKKLDRLRVFAERRPIRPLSVLRVGLPARATLLFSCESPALGLPFPPEAYRGDTLSERSYRFVRDSVMVGAPPWPDTLLIRRFDDSSDEEIALERGELDVAVFWPGELSTRMREDSRWRDFSYGTRSRGVLAVLPARGMPGTFSPSDSSTLSALNEELFRGDLAPWDPSTGRIAPNRLAAPSRWGSQRFEVDHSFPGWQTIERFLNRRRDAQPPPGEPLPLPVTYLDAYVHSPDSLSYAVKRFVRWVFVNQFIPLRPGELEEMNVPSRVLFAIRCPVVCTPALRPYVGALGPDALAEMLDCWPARRAP